MNAYRYRLGDLLVESTAGWSKRYSLTQSFEHQSVKSLIHIQILAAWFMNQFICVIILFTFAIIKVGEIYNKVLPNSTYNEYKFKNDLNKEFYLLANFFDYFSGEFNMLLV